MSSSDISKENKILQVVYNKIFQKQNLEKENVFEIIWNNIEWLCLKSNIINNTFTKLVSS